MLLVMRVACLRGFAACLVSAGLMLLGHAALAQAGGSAWRDTIDVTVRSAEPAVRSRELFARLPAVMDDPVPTASMAKLLAGEQGAIFVSVDARLVVGTDDRITDCTTETSTIRRGSGAAQGPKTPLKVDICPALSATAHFRHGLGLSGQPVASVAFVNVSYFHTDQPPVFVSPADPPRTSGHVLSDTGDWTDNPLWAWTPEPFVVATPAFAAALPYDHDIAKLARVGVMLKLTPRDGAGMIEKCDVSLTSGDARLDAATCKALMSSSYSEFHGRAYNRTERASYPVLVQWHGRSADMIAPALPAVPHMPKDVALTATDRPGGAPPGLQVVPMRISLAADGRATACTVMQSSRSDSWDAAGVPHSPATSAFHRTERRIRPAGEGYL